MNFLKINSRQKFLLLILIICILCIFKGAPSLMIYPGLDEGIVMTGGMRLLSGQLIYRDFFSFWPPGSHILAAVTISIFKNSVLAMNVISLFVQMFKVICVAYIFKNLLVNKRSRYIYWGLIAYYINLVPIYLSYNHKLWSQFFFLLGLVFATVYVKNKKSVILYATGILVGLCAFTTQTEGFAVLITTLLLLISLKAQKKQYYIYFVGIATIWLPFLVYLVITSTFNKFITQVILFPFSGYQTITNNFLSVYLESIISNLHSTGIVSKLIIPLGIVSFGLSLLILKNRFVKKKYKSYLGYFYLATAVLFLLVVYYLGPSPFFWGLLYMSEIRLFFDYKEFFPENIQKKIIIGLNFFSAILIATCLGSIVKNFTFHKITTNTPQLLFPENQANLDAIRFMDKYLDDKSVALIGSMPYEYYVYQINPSNFLDIHYANGYTLPYMLDKELDILQKFKPRRIIIDADGLKFKSSIIPDERLFFSQIINEYHLVDSFYSKDLVGSHLERIEVFERISGK